jgi:CHAD domain-containing protein
MKGILTPIHSDIGGPEPLHGSTALDCQTAFQRIAKSCVQLIQRSRKPAIAADPEAIHTMRIELTCLRAAVLFFSPMTDDVAESPNSKELRWLNAALGQARDDDVTMGYARLNSARYSRLMVELNHWITEGFWLSDTRSLRSERVDGYGQARLREWRHEIWREGQHLRTLGRKRLHRLRIKCKRYRYIGAALRALNVPLARQEVRFCEIARQVHSVLGDLRDLKRLRKAGRGRPPGYRWRKLLRAAEKPFRRGLAKSRT